ncbi:gamma carbonic anhydrase family protein [Candidatus Woesearchaeota archaeon]|nr:gamma carbonic anhydrase family protein [Candidatus Woesearchaeota archaeon]
MINPFKSRNPEIHESCYIADSAQIIGNVKIGSNSSVWPNAVLRGDMNSIGIGKNTNIQDNTTVHIGPKNSVKIGNNITIGHNCIIHGCIIEDNCLIGMGSVIMNGSVIEKNSIIGAGAVVTEGKNIPENSLVLGIPGKVIRKLTKKDIERINLNCKEYLELAEEYKKNK